jgi:hypothetical protein
MRCGKYVSPTCTLDLAPVQVCDRVGVLVTHIPRRRGLHGLSDYERWND